MCFGCRFRGLGSDDRLVDRRTAKVNIYLTRIANGIGGEIQRNEGDGSIHVQGEVYLGKVTPFREALFVLREAHDDRADEDDEEEDADSPEDSPSAPGWST